MTLASYTGSMPTPSSPDTWKIDPTSQPFDSAASVDVSTSSLPPAARTNFFSLALYQILMRTGWIFKTESIIMPAVLDLISGAGWVRGLLPLLSKLGTGVVPLLVARHLKAMRRKKWALFCSTTLTAVFFLCLAGLLHLWIMQQRYWWSTFVFLALYAAFFACIGVNQLALNTLQGKLVRVARRGRLLLFASTIGGVSAVLCAYLLLPGWLLGEEARFDVVFGFAGLLFACAACTALILIEPSDADGQTPRLTWLKYFADAYRTVAGGRNEQRLMLVTLAFSMSFLLFPHYQNLGLQSMQLNLKNMLWWVVFQNIGTAAFSIPAGMLADRYGNRLVLKLFLLILTVAPILAVTLLHGGSPCYHLYAIVFFLLGITPVIVKIIQNYVLEIVEPEEHPKYLSTVSLCMVMPVLLSPGVGWIIDVLGFEIVFITTAGLMLFGWGLTFRLWEPRQDALCREDREATG